MSSPSRISLVCCGLIGTAVTDGPGQESMVERAFAEAIATQGVVSGTSAYAKGMAQISRGRGRPAIDVFDELFPSQQARAQAASLAFERSYRAIIDRSGLEPMPGADQAFDKLTGAGISTCLLTGLPSAILNLVLVTIGWRNRASLTLAPDDATPGFPAPDLVYTALRRTQTTDMSEVAVACGTESGVLAGVRAGARIVAAVLTGPHTPFRLRAAGATHVIDSIAELPGLVA